MLEEAIEVIRTLWQGGVQSHRGRHYRVEHCRVYDLPDPPPEIMVSGFGPKSVKLAACVGDGYCTVQPDADSVALFRSNARGRLGGARRPEGVLGAKMPPRPAGPPIGCGPTRGYPASWPRCCPHPSTSSRRASS